MPKSKEWYKTGFNSEYGDPVKTYTIDDLLEADQKINERDLKKDIKASWDERKELLLTSDHDLWSIDNRIHIT